MIGKRFSGCVCMCEGVCVCVCVCVTGSRNELKKNARYERNLIGQFSKILSKPLHFFDRNERNLSGIKKARIERILSGIKNARNERKLSGIKNARNERNLSGKKMQEMRGMVGMSGFLSGI